MNNKKAILDELRKVKGINIFDAIIFAVLISISMFALMFFLSAQSISVAALTMFISAVCFYLIRLQLKRTQKSLSAKVINQCTIFVFVVVFSFELHLSIKHDNLNILSILFN